jgi:hypothetical protein
MRWGSRWAAHSRDRRGRSVTTNAVSPGAADYHRFSMGLEAECTVRLGRKTSAGKALLESETLVFRGSLRLDIPFDGMKDVVVDGGALVVRTDDQEARFELGAPTAERWARMIREPKGLFEKLEIGPESRVAVVNITDSLFLVALRERAASIAEGRVPGGVPVIFFGAETREALHKVPLLRARMVDSGALWVVRPKGSKAISEAEVLGAFRDAGLVDTKVVAFSKTHTAHKAVIPVEFRGQTVRRRPPFVSLPPPPPGDPTRPSTDASDRKRAQLKTANRAAPKAKRPA